MKKTLFTCSSLLLTGIILTAQNGISVMPLKKINGVLRVSETNPRYFTDITGKAILLTGSHTWANFQEHYTDKDSVLFDWNGYIDMMVKHGHNFMRFWMYEQPEGQSWTVDKAYVYPMCYARTGKENANDGKPKFDLDQWNEEYFKRMRSRIIDAGEHGIYTSVMLFQGWSLNKLANPKSDPFLTHPYNMDNNINGIDVINTINDQADKPTLHSLGNKAALKRQEAYIRKVIETVNDLDNVLFEVINEGGTTEWCYYIINFIRNVEKTMPKQHMIGLGARINPLMPNEELWNSPADYISPSCQPVGWSLPGCIFVEDYETDPPPNNNKKVCITDTDHLWGLGGNYIWAWKSFCRGLNPIFMDSWEPLVGSIDPLAADFTSVGDVTTNQRYYPDYEPLRKNMGYIRNYAEKMNLAAMAPHGELSTTKYCLANPGKEYLIFFPEGGKATVNLTSVKGDLEVEWFIPSQNQILGGHSLIKGGYFANFEAPFAGDAVLYLKKNNY